LANVHYLAAGCALHRTITDVTTGRGTRGVGFLLFIIFTACEVTKSQRLLFGGISWCRLRISSSSVEKRDRKGLSGLNLFSNSFASVNVAEVIAPPRKICRHNRVASRSSNINVSPWSSGFPACKRLEPLQAPTSPIVTAHLQYPRNARMVPVILPTVGAANARIWQNAKFRGESARGRKRKLADSLQLPPIKGIWPPQNLHRILRPTHLGGVSFGAWVAPTSCTYAAGSRIAVGSKNPPMESAHLLSLVHFEFYTLYCSPVFAPGQLHLS